MAKKHISVEVKLEAVLQILDGNKSVREAADSLNLHRDTVNRWVIAYKKSGQNGLENPKAHRSPQSKNSNQKVRELENKLKEKELEIEILKKFQAFLKENE
jgi:transposase